MGFIKKMSRKLNRAVGGDPINKAMDPLGGDLPGVDLITRWNKSGAGKSTGKEARRTYDTSQPYTGGVMKDQVAIEAQKEEERKQAYQAKVATAEERKQRLSAGVLVRRRRRAEQPGNKGGTLLTSQLGVPGNGNAFGALLGL